MGVGVRDRLLSAGCMADEATGWAREMEGMQEHSVLALVEKITHLKQKELAAVAATRSQPPFKVKPPPQLPPLEPVPDNGVFVNPETGEIGGPRGPEPTRFSDWSYKGRCTDF